MFDSAAILDRARTVLATEIEALDATRNALDSGFCRAVACLFERLRERGKIVVTGVGKSLHIAEKLASTFASTGAPSVVLNPTQAMHGDLGILNGGDVLLALSFSGESDELLACIPAVRRMGIPIVALTGCADSTLARGSDIVIRLSVPREACPFNLAPTASTTATLAVGDALAMALLDAQGLQKEDYARLHPAGAIGRTLLCRVRDIMRTGERLAVVAGGATVRDALLAMTRARTGSACVVDAAGCLSGIFTDGDLRRQLTGDTGVGLDQPVAQRMTPDPVRIDVDRLAVEVLKVFEAHAIDDLPVVDDAGRLVGIIDVQDLPHFKIL